MLITVFLPGLSREISLRGSDSWGRIEELNSIELYQGKGDFGNLGIKSAVYPLDRSKTDLLIHFDNPGIRDTAGNYRIDSEIRTTDIVKKIGNRSGVFRGDEKGVILYPEKGALFSPGNLIDSFTIEFWLNPSRFSEDAVIFSYSGTLRDETGNIIPQELLGTLKDRKITWEFRNFFYSEGVETYISLTGLSPIIPDIWHHHLIRYDSSTGIIEYLVDGKPEAIKYSTSSGNEDITVLSPLISSLGTPSLNLGKNFTGFMDEVRISDFFVESPVIYRYQETRGNVVSQTIDLGRAGSKLEKISVIREIPEDSAIFFYYKISDKLADMSEETEWYNFHPGERLISKNRGRYLKIRLELEPDGEEILSPLIFDVVIQYEKNLKPLAPSYLNAEGADESVILTWPSMGEPDVRGYLLYYGTSKGNYFGSGALEGDSPILISGKTINSYTVHGLENGRLYYFSIAAFDDAGTELPGNFSNEITSRPVEQRDN